MSYLYGEVALQKTVPIDDSKEVSLAVKTGRKILPRHFCTLPGVGKIAINPACTDIFPSMFIDLIKALF